MIQRVRAALACAVLFCAASQLFAENRDHRPVKPAQLYALIQKADQVIVSEPEVGSEGQVKVLFSSSDPKDISELRKAITLEPPGAWFVCMCIGSPQIRLLRKGKELVFLSNQHGTVLHTSLWSGDARIKDPEKWLHWFDARGITGPRKEFEQEIAREKESQAAEERWVKAMPASLRPLWDKFLESTDVITLHSNHKVLDMALAKEFPLPQQRIRALLSWYGSGAGPWSGFPGYEEVAEEMLLDYSTSEILTAVQSTSLSQQELEGTARLFGGWTFNERRPVDNALLPADLKKTLLQHSLQSSDEDKVARARRAFSQP